ncbi:MarR family winged helix-turn-helix transcriptional regulator [Isoptericola sp. BMS4]|uniref:MarR family winged helix-turn-helix transcriptional regulator n=1 Tax=Isoptericola sp. BMS4 TaxID=2527875 RepID=UPI00141E530C|nr:MarR family transcriptional regulator [Isoptericola sp. BMS4]
MDPAPLAPERLGPRLAEILLLVGPLYRKSQRLVEDAEGADGVSVGVRAVLDMLRVHGDLTVPQMARAQSLSRQFVQRTVNDALAGGWAAVRANPRHKRSSLITLTDEGRTVITAIAAREQGRLGTVAGDLTDHDVDACARVLTAILDELRDVRV